MHRFSLMMLKASYQKLTTDTIKVPRPPSFGTAKVKVTSLNHHFFSSEFPNKLHIYCQEIYLSVYDHISWVSGRIPICEGIISNFTFDKIVTLLQQKPFFLVSLKTDLVMQNAMLISNGDLSPHSIMAFCMPTL